VILAAASAMSAAQISVVSIHDWPNERFSNQLPVLAIDGNTSTFTWSSESGSTAEQSLGLDFGLTYYLNQIRLWKSPDGGGGQNVKNLFIEITNSSVVLPLSARTWVAVTNMVNGHNGLELLNATSVNSNGSVIRDVHDSDALGWASLSFEPVLATGVRIRFNNPDVTTFNHYHVSEFEAFGDPVPEPSSLWLIAGAAAMIAVRRQWRG